MKSKLAIILPSFIIVFCAVGFLFAPHDPNHIDLGKKFFERSMEYPLGTDQVGRCIYSRLLYGGKTTVGIIVFGSVVISLIGSALGLILGLSGNKKNVVMESILNAVTAIPPIAYLIIFIGAWGNGLVTMIMALTVSLVLRLIKLVKTKTEIELRKAYIACAISSGATRLNILFVHVLPNILYDVIHFICLSSAEMILTITGFSFIGLGFGDNIIDWGKMISDARGMMIIKPDAILYPIALVFICAFCFNLLSKEFEKRGTHHA